ncbi:hypothetical protein RvY_12193 [Ramazzottius varieornatus]|uniref:DUF6570 domain-containing protein n=1 Tax=Ramazzottius varieornatus TaxID=947166 RepID=A0A1D1VIM4_RAMVA|nr:hypothetical protein RvY_12193 [Ramazzottius varieornatus]
MDPGAIVPDKLRILSQVEMLIAQVAAVVQVRQLKGEQRGYSGNILNFPQDVQGFVKTLPEDCKTSISSLFGEWERMRSYIGTHMQRETGYGEPCDIVIDQDNPAALPEGDISLLLPSMQVQRPLDPDAVDAHPSRNDEENNAEEQENINTFAIPQHPRLTDQITIDNYIRNLHNVHAMWPKISSKLVNEFETVGYISLFPTLVFANPDPGS